jgi:acetate kinase
MNILVLNSGSSSQKASLYVIGETLPIDLPRPLWEAKIEWHDESAAVEIKNADGVAHTEREKFSSRASIIEHLLQSVWGGKAAALATASQIDVVGHRVVHGGPRYLEPTLLTSEVKSGIAEAAAFAPLHNRAEIEGMDVVERILGTVPQVAVFDTGFHRHIPLAAAVYSGPYTWFEQGIQRYGFHGINHQYCAERAAHLLERDLHTLKLVTCHLGNGCSLAAIREGKSVDTTMGFTPLEGLMMGTRSGSIDPGILTYLIREGKLNPEEIDDLLNKESGLKGVSGVSGDMREILASIKQGNARAQLAFDMYIHRLQAGIGAMVASLGGLDALVFTAGVGENSAEVRLFACGNLAFLGLQINDTANTQSPSDQNADHDIATPDSKVRVLVIRAQEDWAIAAQCWHLTRSASS